MKEIRGMLKEVTDLEFADVLTPVFGMDRYASRRAERQARGFPEGNEMADYLVLGFANIGYAMATLACALYI